MLDIYCWCCLADSSLSSSVVDPCNSLLDKFRTERVSSKQQRCEPTASTCAWCLRLFPLAAQTWLKQLSGGIGVDVVSQNNICSSLGWKVTGEALSLGSVLIQRFHQETSGVGSGINRTWTLWREWENFPWLQGPHIWLRLQNSSRDLGSAWSSRKVSTGFSHISNSFVHIAWLCSGQLEESRVFEQSTITCYCLFCPVCIP